jgi:ABC-type Na+ efflux pump permease subunit
MFPLVERELRVAARKGQTFRIRGWVAVITFLITALNLLLSAPSPRGSAGRSLFEFFAIAGLVYCFFQALRQTSDSIAFEKREGTIGFLFLTDLRPFDIVTGKLCAQGIQIFNHLLAFFPVFSICLLFGGVTGGECARMTILLTNNLFITLALGLLASSAFTKVESCIAGAALLLAVFALGPMILSPVLDTFVVHISPLRAYSAALSSSPEMRVYFWVGQAIAHVIGWGCLALSGWLLARRWQMKGDAPAASAAVIKSSRFLTGKSKILDENPFMWLTYRPRQRVQFYFIFLIGVGVLIVGGIFSGFRKEVLQAGNYFLSFLFFIYLCSQASRNFAEATRSDAFELILSTPITTKEMIQGQIAALTKFFVPAGIILLAIKLAAHFQGMNIAGFCWDAASFVVTALAVSWFGMWMGLTRKPAAAFFATFIYCYLLPTLFCLGGLVPNILLFAISMNKVQDHFRRLAVSRSQQTSQFFTL